MSARRWWRRLCRLILGDRRDLWAESLALRRRFNPRWRFEDATMPPDDAEDEDVTAYTPKARAEEIAAARARLDEKFHLNRDGVQTRWFGRAHKSFDSWERRKRKT